MNDLEIKNLFIDELNLEMKKLNISSYAELSRLSGIPKNTISNWVKGLQFPNLKSLYLLSQKGIFFSFLSKQ